MVVVHDPTVLKLKVNQVVEQDEERMLHEQKLAKMQAETKMMFQLKMAEKESKLRQFEQELYGPHRELEEESYADKEERWKGFEDEEFFSWRERGVITPMSLRAIGSEDKKTIEPSICMPRQASEKGGESLETSKRCLSLYSDKARFYCGEELWNAIEGVSNSELGPAITCRSISDYPQIADRDMDENKAGALTAFDDDGARGSEVERFVQEPMEGLGKGGVSLAEKGKPQAEPQAVISKNSDETKASMLTTECVLAEGEKQKLSSEGKFQLQLYLRKRVAMEILSVNRQRLKPVVGVKSGEEGD
ncbi:Cell division control protein 3 [Rhizina undulata]